MADKATPAKAGQSDAPIAVSRIVSRERGGVSYPAVFIKGEAPRKGSTLRVRLDNGITYTGKVAGHAEVDGEMLVETDGLEPETEPPSPETPPSDIVAG